MKPLCIVDTCSLIYLSEIELAGRSLHRWLWDEFNVTYSQSVWDEIERNARKMGRDARAIKRNGERFVSGLSKITAYENALFGPPFVRNEQVGICRTCKRPEFQRRQIQVNLAADEDKGERHNCCVSLDIVVRGEHRQVIFLTDDRTAIRKYVSPVFEVFPLGHIWLSHDFVLYLFTRHRKRITLNEAELVLRDVNAKAASSGFSGHSHQAQQEWMQRLREYMRKAARINEVLSRISGGS